MMKLEN